MSLDLISTPTSTKSADDTETDTPPHTVQPIKPLSSTYGGALHNHRHPPPPPVMMVTASYKECMKNHAASIGGHSVDGCGEFIMTSPSTAAADPTSLKCAACGCHRNFHRRELADSITPPFLDFRHPHFPNRFSLSPSPPPPPRPSAPALYEPHGLFGLGAEEHQQAPVTPTAEFYPVGRKRFRSKFSQEQKDKMRSFSVKMGWKMQKSDESTVREFCSEIGVTRGVLKVWMHNNKNTFCKKEISGGGGGGAGNISTAQNVGLISFENDGGGGDDVVRQSEERSTDINGSQSQNSNGSSSPSST